MFILYAVVVGIVAGYLTGGRLEGLATVRFRWAGLAIAGFAIQLILFLGPVAEALDGAPALGVAAYVGSTALVLGAVLANLRLRGLAIVALGAALNAAAIVANGGIMPTTVGALAIAGRAPGIGFSNSAVRVDPALPWLVDRFGLPSWLPLANVFSLGDVIIGLGIAIAVAAGMRARSRTADAAPVRPGPR
ncbi:MAG: DUF5317 family protein [Chloroflexi bacterium]|nr:DUF5317 family protein [Chloroflexota bacterium]